MDGLELWPGSRFRSHLRDRLWIYRSSPKSWLRVHPCALGERRSSTNLFLGPAMVPSRDRPHLFDRVRFALGASGRTDRSKWYFAGKPISTGSSWTVGPTGLFALA